MKKKENRYKSGKVNVVQIEGEEELKKIDRKVAFLYYGNMDQKTIFDYFHVRGWLKNNLLTMYIVNTRCKGIIDHRDLKKKYQEVAYILLDDIKKNVTIERNLYKVSDDTEEERSNKLKRTVVYGRVRKKRW